MSAMRTKDQAEAWLNGGWKKDKYEMLSTPYPYPSGPYRYLARGINVDMYYGYQCMDFVMAYTLFLANWRPYGNAIDLWSQPLPSGWKRLKFAERQAGDIVVYGKAYGSAGHTEVLVTKSVAIAQNWNNPNDRYGSKPVRHTVSGSGVLGVIRPKYAPEKLKYKVTKITHSYDKPTTKSKRVKLLPRGFVGEYKSIVTGEKRGGDNRWRKTVKGDYVMVSKTKKV